MKISSIKNQITVLFSVLIIAVTIFGSTLLISKTKFYIRDSGSAVSKDGEIVNTISVSGDGKVYAKPDMMTINVRVSEVRSTSKEALEAVNKKIDEVKNKAKDNGVKDEDLKTTQLSIYPKYEYKNGSSILVGQQASQSIDISMKKIDIKAKEVSTLIDEVAEIDDIQLGWIRFDIEDKTEYYSRARELAFKKAKQKASELSDLAEVDLLEAVSITDTSVDYETQQFKSVNQYTEAMAGEDESSTDISTGQLGLSIRISVKFGIG